MTNQIFKIASAIYKSKQEKGIQVWYSCIRQASVKMFEAKLLKFHEVTFVKKDGTRVTRSILPISLAGYENKSFPIKFIDREKLESTGEPASSIISFQKFQYVPTN